VKHPVPRVQAAVDGSDTSSLIAATDHSVLLLGEHQFYPGYCVLFALNPVKELHQLPPADYLGFMVDLRRAGAALEAAYKPWKINLASLGNQTQHLHVHLFPRESDDVQKLQQPWIHEAQFKAAPADAEAVRHLKAAWEEVKP
jgi:diadenosine tetraphosphate (Ap4A) HIT family hydrolase